MLPTNKKTKEYNQQTTLTLDYDANHVQVSVFKCNNVTDRKNVTGKHKGKGIQPTNKCNNLTDRKMLPTNNVPKGTNKPIPTNNCNTKQKTKKTKEYNEQTNAIM